MTRCGSHGRGTNRAPAKARSALAGAVATLAGGAAAAHPDPTPLARAGGEDMALAPAGREALFARATGRTLRLLAVPVGGGRPSTRLRFVAPPGARARRLAASATVAALTVTTSDEESELAAFQAFAGPPTGPFEALGPLTPLDAGSSLPAQHQAGAEPVPVAIPAVGVFTAVFAGELVAYGEPVAGQPGDDEPRRLVLAEWRSGGILRRVRIAGGIEALALAPDGRVVVGEDGGGLLEVAPGAGGVRRLSRVGERPVVAGSSVIAVRASRREGDERLIRIGRDGRLRPFGVPTVAIGPVLADAERVLWGTNDCVLSARVGEPPARGPVGRSSAPLRRIRPTLPRSPSQGARRRPTPPRWTDATSAPSGSCPCPGGSCTSTGRCPTG